MTARDLASEVMRNLGRRKLRTGLTMAGVVIGALAVVLIVSLGNGRSSFIDNHVRAFYPVGEDWSGTFSKLFRRMSAGGALPPVPAKKGKSKDKGVEGAFYSTRENYPSDQAPPAPHRPRQSPAVRWRDGRGPGTRHAASLMPNSAAMT